MSKRKVIEVSTDFDDDNQILAERLKRKGKCVVGGVKTKGKSVECGPLEESLRVVGEEPHEEQPPPLQIEHILSEKPDEEQPEAAQTQEEQPVTRQRTRKKTISTKPRRGGVVDVEKHKPRNPHIKVTPALKVEVVSQPQKLNEGKELAESSQTVERKKVKREPSVGLCKQRQSVSAFMRFLNAIEEDSPTNREKKNAVSDLGFGGLLQMRYPKENDVSFCGQLVSHYDFKTNTLRLPGRDRFLQVTETDFHAVYGIPMGDIEVIEDINVDGFKDVISSFREYVDVRSGSVPVNRIVDLLIDESVDDDWKRCFIIMASNTCIKSTGNPQTNWRVLASTVDLSMVPKLDWCSYALNSLNCASEDWQKDPSRWYTGPLPFLVIFYFDRVKRLEEAPPRNFPIVSSWTVDDICSRFELEHNEGFGDGEILGRIPLPIHGALESEDGATSGESTHTVPERFSEPNQAEQRDVPPSETKPPSEDADYKLPRTFEEFHQEFSTATAELTTAVMKFNRLLKISEAFFPGNVMQNDMPQNLAILWEKCTAKSCEVGESGWQDDVPFPSEPENNPGCSVLSQDLAFFSSKFLHDKFDEEVERHVKARKAKVGSSSKAEEVNPFPTAVPFIPPSVTPVDLNSEMSPIHSRQEVDLGRLLATPILDPNALIDTVGKTATEGPDISIENLQTHEVPQSDRGKGKVDTNVHTPEDHMKHVISHGDSCEGRGKRNKQESYVFRSPFMVKYSHLSKKRKEDRQLNEEGLENVDVADYAFSLASDMDELLYDDGHNYIIRSEINDLGSDRYFKCNIVDVWAFITNRRELQRRPKQPKILCFSCVPFDMLCGAMRKSSESDEDTQDTPKKRLDDFLETIVYELNERYQFPSLKYLRYVLFPVCTSDHYYLYAINLTAGRLELIDNSPLGDTPFESKYYDYYSTLVTGFNHLCGTLDFPLRKTLIEGEVDLFTLEWATSENKIDCGVYLMRHMETFNVTSKWETGLSKDNLDMLKQLRMRYAAEILTHDLNKLKHKVLSRATAFKNGLDIDDILASETASDSSP